MTHFEIFDLPRSFELDQRVLEERFRKLSLELHPDRASPGERRLAVERTASLNEAYRVLKDPVRRAFYLLGLHGGALETPERAVLEQVLSLSEELAEAGAGGDLEKVRALAEQVEAEKGAALEEAARALRGLESGQRREEELQRAASALAKLRYLARFLEEVERIEEEALS